MSLPATKTQPAVKVPNLRLPSLKPAHRYRRLYPHPRNRPLLNPNQSTSHRPPATGPATSAPSSTPPPTSSATPAAPSPPPLPPLQNQSPTHEPTPTTLALDLHRQGNQLPSRTRNPPSRTSASSRRRRRRCRRSRWGGCVSGAAIGWSSSGGRVRRVDL